MNDKMADKLAIKAEEVARNYSDPDRAMNFNKETFEVDRIIPLSEHTAAVIYTKNTGKKAVAFFHLMKNIYWDYFFPTDGHIIGMEAFGKVKLKIEMGNYNKGVK